jgi:hypothetical protein
VERLTLERSKGSPLKQEDRVRNMSKLWTKVGYKGELKKFNLINIYHLAEKGQGRKAMRMGPQGEERPRVKRTCPAALRCSRGGQHTSMLSIWPDVIPSGDW